MELNVTALEEICPTFDDSDFELLGRFSFWLEGVSQTILAIFGILGNCFSCFILTRRRMRRNQGELKLIQQAIN